MAKGIEDVLGGAIGEFWLLPSPTVGDLDDDSLRGGFIRKLESAIEVRVLQDSPVVALRNPVQTPFGIIGASEPAGVVVLEMFDSSGQINIGGARASVDRHRGSTLIASPRVTSVSSLLPTYASARFEGNALLAWAGIDAAEDEFETDEAGLVQSATIRLKPAPDLPARLSPSLTLRFTAHWAVNRDNRRAHILEIALEVAIESSRPREMKELLRPLLRVQDLMAICFNGFVPAATGRASLPGIESRADMWDSALMRSDTPLGVPLADLAKWPVLSLEHIGGPEAVARWLRLTEKHPRAVGPVVAPFRDGISSDSSRLQELAAAMEYWVAAHRRRGPWTHQGDNHAAAVALHVGPSFNRWVGDAEKWAEEFWRHYNGLKHDPAFSVDPLRLSVLQHSAQVLMCAELLIRVARSKVAARRLLRDYRFERLGIATRTLLGT